MGWWSKLFKKKKKQSVFLALIEEFYDKVFADKELAPFFEGVDKEVLITKMVGFIEFAAGESDEYKGKDLYEAHKHLPIKEHHFNKVAGYFLAAMDKVNIKSEVKRNLTNKLLALKSEILRP